MLDRFCKFLAKTFASKERQRESKSGYFQLQQYRPQWSPGASLSTLVVGDDPSRMQQIEELMAGEPSLRLTAATSFDDARETIAALLPHLVWIDLGTSPVKGLALAADLKEKCPYIRFWVSDDNLDLELVRLAYRFGAADFLDAQTWHQELSSCVLRVQGLLKRAAEPIEIAVEEHELDLLAPGHAPANHRRKLNTLVVCDAIAETRQSIEAVIELHKHSISLSTTVASQNACEYLRQGNIQLVWLELTPDINCSLALLKKLKELFPMVYIFVSFLGADSPNGSLIRTSYRFGADDFIYRVEGWDGHDLVLSLQKIVPVMSCGCGN